MHRYLILFALLGINTKLLRAQQISVLTSGTHTSIRGLSVVNDNVLWVSGSNGTVGKSIDAGKTWQWQTVKGFEKRDFRDVEAFDDHTAIIMAVAEPALILKTVDGGEHWKVVFIDSTKGMFLDAMDFYDKNNGIVVGDPVNTKFFTAKTKNGGDSWAKIPWVMQSKAAEGEGCFAASGTNVLYFRNKDFLFVSGGKESRLHDDTGGRMLSIIHGKETAGANSIAVLSRHTRVNNYFIIVGGDFTNDKDTTLNCLLTHDGGQTWIHPTTPPHGYRSCVEYLTSKKLVACGTSGVDVSVDTGMNWQLISPDAYNVCQKAKKGKVIYLAGNNGKIAKLLWK